MIKCEVKGLNSAIKGAQRNLERYGMRYVETVAANTARGLSDNATLPLGKSQRSKKGGKLKNGEGSVSKDIGKAIGGTSRAFKTVQEHDEKHARQVVALMKLKKLPEASAVARRAGALLSFHSAMSPQLHQQARRNGRVSRFTGKVTTDFKGLDRYRKQTFKHVGKAKAGWLMTGGAPWETAKVPAWILRHGRNGVHSVKGWRVSISNPVAYAKEAMIQRQIYFVMANAIKRTNTQFNAEWKKLNNSN